MVEVDRTEELQIEEKGVKPADSNNARGTDQSRVLPPKELALVFFG